MPTDNQPRNKVQSVIERRGLHDLETEVQRRWHGTGYKEHSTRELARFFNKTLLWKSISETGSISLDGEIENIYQLLTDEGVSAGSAAQARDRLREYGVDVEDLEGDFVSHQTMYRYLKDIVEVDTSKDKKSTNDLIEATQQSLQRLNSRTQSVATENIKQLANREEFQVGDFDIYVSTQFRCNDCGVTRDLKYILDHNGCDCD